MESDGRGSLNGALPLSCAASGALESPPREGTGVTICGDGLGRDYALSSAGQWLGDGVFRGPGGQVLLSVPAPLQCTALRKHTSLLRMPWGSPTTCLGLLYTGLLWGGGVQDPPPLPRGAEFLEAKEIF